MCKPIQVILENKMDVNFDKQVTFSIMVICYSVCFILNKLRIFPLSTFYS